MMQGTEMSVSGVLRVYTKDELMWFLKVGGEPFLAEYQLYGDHLGGLLRTFEQE